MQASVIVPTRNRADTLGRCLDSLRNQSADRDHFEIIVVDNGSTDHTHELVSRYVDSLPIRYVLAEAPGLHVGRHTGMRAARSDILMFADDDIQAGEGWIEAVVRAFDSPDIALVGGNNIPDFEQPPPPWLARWWQQQAYRGQALGHLSILDFGEGRFDIDPGYVWGCNFSARRSLLEASKGFHPDGFPISHLRFRGDGETHVSDTVRRLGLRAVFDSQASVRHFVPAERMTLAYFERRAYAQGISDSYTDIRRLGGKSAPLGQRMRREVSGLRSVLTNRCRSAIARQDEYLRELLVIQNACLAAHRRGYASHQAEVLADPSLLKWVLQSDYLDG